MASFITTNRRNSLVNYMFRGGAAPFIGTYYLGLFTVAPTIAGGGTEVPSASAYARVAVTNVSGNWAAPDANSLISNAVAFTFPTATGSWGTVIGVGIFDASTGGTLLAYGDLTTAKTISNTDVLSFPIASLTYTQN